MEHNKIDIKKPPKGLAVLALVGPSFIWCAEYIGSGEVILATRTGAILGHSLIWVVVLGIFLKYWIGMSGARYTVCTGEGMIDMFSRIPGPKNWVVWIVLFAQFISAAISIGSVASAAGIFLSSIVPVSPFLCGWLITIFSLIAVWSGKFNFLKIVMSLFIMVIIIGVLYVAVTVSPGIKEIIKSLIPNIPVVPEWAISQSGISSNPWREILPLLGWGAGGFASQVWYTYWVLGAGYGAAEGQHYGEPAHLDKLKNIDKKTANKLLGWCKVVYTDATIALIIGSVVTVGFLLAGAGILHPQELAPKGAKVAITLSKLFSSKWGSFGGFVFMITATAALLSTQIGQLAGWPRLLADAFRICFPSISENIKWKIQFRTILLFFFLSNMIIIYSFGLKPVIIVQIGAILDGLLLTPLQAIWIMIGLYYVMPKMFNKEVAEIIKPHWIFSIGLSLAFIVFGYFCIFQMPFVFK